MRAVWATTRIIKEYVWMCPICEVINIDDEDTIRDNPTPIECEGCDNCIEVFVGDSL